MELATLEVACPELIALPLARRGRTRPHHTEMMLGVVPGVIYE
jgi:hypothetical protein